MRTLIILALFCSALPAVAQSPTSPASSTPAGPSSFAGTAVTPAPVGPPPSLLDSLIGKKQIVGLTRQDGTRYLCRFNSGDHGLYIVQEFHFAGPPHVSTQTVAASQGAPVPHYKTVTLGSGRTRQRVQVLTGYSNSRASKGGRVEVKTDTTIPDEQAVRLLLAGVAGANRSPREIEAGRDMLSPSQIKVLQLLSPPAWSTTATPQSLPPSTARSIAASLIAPPVGSSAPPVAASAAPPSSSAWTLTTIWPTTTSSLENSASNRPARTRGRKRSG